MSDSPDSHAIFRNIKCVLVYASITWTKSNSHHRVYVHQNEYNAVYNITDYFSWIFNFTMKASNQHKLSLKFTSLISLAVAFFYTIPALIFNGRTPARAAYMVKYVCAQRQKKIAGKDSRISLMLDGCRISTLFINHSQCCCCDNKHQSTEHLPEFK